MDFAELKKFFLFNLIGSLVISALVAVVTVLIGEFNEIAGRVLLTLFMVIIHSLVSLLFIWNDDKQDTFDKFSIFTNALFLIIILSFLTSIFGVWEILPGEVVGDVYQTFFILGFAALHVDILSKALGKEGYIDAVVYVNYIFIALVVLMIQPIIFIDNAFRELGEMFYRILGAAAIIDGTLTILTIIFYKLYLHKHPRTENPMQGYIQPGDPAEKKKGLSIWVWILLVYLTFQIILPFIGFIFFRF